MGGADILSCLHPLEAGRMDIYFCEKCGKRLTSDNIARGEAKNKKLRGVFCTDCSEGVMTMEMLPLTDDAAKALLFKPAPKPQASPPRDATTRPPPVQKRAAPFIAPYAAAAAGLALAAIVMLIVGGKPAPSASATKPAIPEAPPPPSPAPVAAAPIVTAPPVPTPEPAPAEKTPAPQVMPSELETPPVNIAQTPAPSEPGQPPQAVVDDVPEPAPQPQEPEPKAAATPVEPPAARPANTPAPGEQIIVLRLGQPLPELKLAAYTKLSDVNLYSWKAHADIVQEPKEFLKVSGSSPALIRFRVFAHEGGPLPDTAEILEAKLILHKETHYAGYFALDALAENWDPAGATYNSAAKGRPWKTPGGSTRTPMVASAWQKNSVSKPTPHLAHAFDVTAYLRETQKTRTNFGWRLQAYETDERKNAAKGTPGPQFISSRHANAEMRPALELRLKAPKPKD